MKICKHNNGIGHCGISGEYCVEGPCHCEELIEYEPVRHGKWGKPVKVDADNVGYNCSECGEFGAPCWNYCPHCGCKMDGGAE